MHTLLGAALVVMSATASQAAAFRFDAATGRCVDPAGREGWNGSAPGPCADLRALDLAGAQLGGVDLRGARFEGAKLDHADLFRADLRGAHLDGAQLAGADLRHARLEGATLAGARLVNARLQFARLGGARLDGADLRLAALHGAAFAGADLRGARFSREPALLGGARFGGALVDAGTLPFGAEKLARLGVTLAAVVSR